MKSHKKRFVSESIVSPARAAAICSIFGLIAIATAAPPVTLDDNDKTNPPAARPRTPDIYSLPFPRLNLTEGTAGSDIEVASKFNTVSYSAAQIGNAAALKIKYPQTMVLRYFVSGSYQPANEGDGSQRSFLSTGLSSTGSAVYAGHWVYLAGSKLRTSIDSKALVLSVNDSSRFTPGQYVVIYNGSPGDFLNAEHAKIKSVDHTKGTVTLMQRGYKSTPAAHAAGAIVAQHELGAAGGGGPARPEAWAYNLSSKCPRDASGKQMNQVNAEWLAAHFNLDRNGKMVGNFSYDGVLFDGERNYFFPDPTADLDNDLVAEGGLNPSTGENMEGEGLEALYAKLRSLIGDSKIMIASNGSIRGYPYLNGVQCEGYPNISSSYVYPPNYSLTDSKLASYSYHLHHHAYGPLYTEVLSKTPTLLYPHLDNGGSPPKSNSPFRYSFGFALLENGSYGQKRPGDHPWFDEYAVDANAHSATFGQAIPNNDSNTSQIARVRAHTGWLGAPLGRRTRIFDPALFDVSKTLLPNGGFESGLGGWTGHNVNVSLQTASVFAGKNCLHASPMLKYTTDRYSASATSPAVRIAAADTYTLCFAVKSSRVREFAVQFGTATAQTIISGPNWQSHTLTFQTTAGAQPVKFYLGTENSDLWVDEIYLFHGSADVFRRDFQNGTVFVNATSAPRTVATKGSFRRIKGTQDPVNNGASVGAQLTVPAYDSAILVRVP
jgi:hypothetical protein